MRLYRVAGGRVSSEKSSELLTTIEEYAALIEAAASRGDREAVRQMHADMMRVFDEFISEVEKGLNDDE